ncbi:sensor histidine kinase [Paenibacillus eucommiae]|uniref:Two-component system sensor histidine kinase YesM n=1 Tax=Paenibacillus eucommiae TaxID=1355755 RepID=A0ABS4IM59_9BACL|nr:histidine kinase [Paenibacillus eucommiae]MBP1988653.1 two-component system sensor histidine kinase YesM [Paenibacillus eucommiae]
MSLVQSRNRSTIFIKLMITFLAVLTPIFLLTLIINQKGSTSIRNEVSQSMANRNGFYLNLLEMEIGRIIKLLPEYVVDKDLMELSVTGDKITSYEKMEKISAIQRGMHLMKYSSLYIQEARAYIPLMERTILSSDFETTINQQQFEAIQQKNNIQASPLIYLNHRLYVSMQYPALLNRQPVFVVEVELSVEKLQDTLSNVVSTFKGNAVLMNLTEDWKISGEQDSAILSSIQLFLQGQEERGLLAGYNTLVFNHQKYLVSYQKSATLDSYLVSYVPEGQILGQVDKYRSLIWVLSLLSLCIILFFSFSIIRLIHRPLKRLIRAFNRMQAGDLQPIFHSERKDEFGYLYQGFNDTVSHLKTLIFQNYEQKIRNQRSELKWLQSQINPHFLYNCFFVLCRLIKLEDNELAYRFCLYVGEYFQFITRDGADDIAIELEIKHASTYVDIQKICFGKRIKIQFDPLDQVLYGKVVPRLILQPIIENVYKYAFGHMEGKGELRFHMAQEGDDLFIFIEDSGDSLTDQEITKLNEKLRLSSNYIEDTTGIMNVHRRIQLKYGEGYGIYLVRSELGGLRVEIRIALREGEI